MKSLLILAVTLFSVGAFACPDLEGIYSCVDQTGESFPESVTQSLNEDGVMEYIMSGDVIIADGVKRTDKQGTDTIVNWAMCNKNVLNLNINFNLPSEGAKIKMRVKVKPTNKGFVGNGTVKVIFDGQTFNEKIKTTCTRN